MNNKKIDREMRIISRFDRLVSGVSFLGIRDQFIMADILTREFHQN